MAEMVLGPSLPLCAIDHWPVNNTNADSNQKTGENVKFCFFIRRGKFIENLSINP
jgi:hypothetical protein